MGKVTQVNNNDSGLTARTNYNEAMKNVESDSSLSGSGTAGDPLKVESTNSYFDNVSATTAPAITNDSSENYGVGSTWIDIANDNVYKCVDATVGAAVWEWLNKPSSGGGGGLTIPTQTPVTLTNGATTDISLDDTLRFNSFADGVTTHTFTASGGSDIQVKAARRKIDNSANNSAVTITLSDTVMDWNEDDGNSLSIAANSIYYFDIFGESASVIGVSSFIPLK